MSPRHRKPPPPSDELRERFGGNLRRCRKQLGVSQHELAFRSELHIGAVSRLELGQKVPFIDTVIRLAGVLEVAPYELAAGIRWVPAEVHVVPGAFEVPEDPALAREVAALRAAGSGRRGGSRG